MYKGCPINSSLNSINTYYWFDFGWISTKTDASQHPLSLLCCYPTNARLICIAPVQHTPDYTTVVQPGMRAVISEIIVLLDYMTTQCQCQQCLIRCYHRKQKLAKYGSAYCLSHPCCHCHQNGKPYNIWYGRYLHRMNHRGKYKLYLLTFIFLHIYRWDADALTFKVESTIQVLHEQWINAYYLTVRISTRANI